MQKMSDNGLNLLKQYEALILFAYDDFDPPRARRKIKHGDKVNGTLTIGYGHTGSDVTPGMVISETQADELLHRDVAPMERKVASTVKVPLNQNQFDALVSFCFNVGEGNFASSTLVKKLNAGEYDAVPKELMKWTKSKGQQMKGLVNRRAAEAGLWAKGGFIQSSGTVPEKTTPSLVSPQAVTGATAVVSALGSGWMTGNGPVQYAFAVVLVIAVCVGGYLYIRSRRST